MRQISSRFTFFYKFILPWSFVLGLIDLLWRQRTMFALPSSETAYIAIMLVGFCVWMIWLGWPLKKVSIFGDKLYVSNFRKEIAIPISEIVDVRGNIWVDPQRVTIYLRNETEFGSMIRFLAKYRLFDRWSTHPIVNELLDLARSQT